MIINNRQQQVIAGDGNFHIKSVFHADVEHGKGEAGSFAVIQLPVRIPSQSVFHCAAANNHIGSFRRHNLHFLHVAVVILQGDSNQHGIAGSLRRYRDIYRGAGCFSHADYFVIHRESDNSSIVGGNREFIHST